MESNLKIRQRLFGVILSFHFALLSTSCLVLVWLLIIRPVVRATFSPLRSLPGPLLARFTRLWCLEQVWRGKLPRTNIELHRKYGPIVRIAPNEYSIDDPSAVKILYGHGTTFTKGPWYSASSNARDKRTNMFADRDPKHHAVQRRKFASLYSMSTVVKMEEAVNECIVLLEKRLRGIAQSKHVIDLRWWLQCFAFDAIGAITMSKRFGFLEAGTDPLDLVSGLDDFLAYAARVGVYSELHPILFRLLKGGSGLANVLIFAQKQIKEYQDTKNSLESNVENGDFIAKILRLHQEKPHEVSEYDVFLAVSTNILGGSDTTSISAGSIMWGLLKNPEVMAKLRAEVDEKSSGQISDPVTFAETQRMSYLQAAVKEGLRMHAVGGLPLSRVVPKGGAVIADQFFPEGTIVGINAWVAHYNKGVFGEDVDTFRPDRWLTSKEAEQKLDRYFLPFGTGSRTCIGKNIALMEISKLIPQLVRKFDFTLVDTHAKLETWNSWFVKQKHIMVRVSERKEFPSGHQGATTT